MILRKPYAFLIKYFNVIHLLLVILMAFFFVRMRDIVTYLTDYRTIGTYARDSGVAGEYVGFWGFMLPIIIITIIIAIIALLHTKQKPIKYYLITVGVYLLELIIMIVAFVELTSIEQGEASSSLTKIICDLVSAFSYVPLPCLIVSLIRGVGFNIKQFNFKKDLIELNITDEDSEEFEVELEVDTENFKAKINRRFRFIKYVYLENKPVFFTILGVVVIAMIFSIVSFINGIEHIYGENETFSAYGTSVTVNNSYKTKYAIDGSTIDKDKFYIVVIINVKNNREEEITLPYDKIYIRIGENNKVSPIDNYKTEFADFGLRYTSSDTISSLEERQVVLVYELSMEYYNQSFRLEYLITKNDSESETGYKYTKIKLNTDTLDEDETITTVKLGEELIFDNSLIEGTKITINSVEFSKKYSYKYQQTIGGVVKEFTKSIIPTDTSSYKKTIMKLSVSLIKNEELYSKIYSSFYENFLSISYEIDGKMVQQKVTVIDLTPTNSEYIYLEVVEEVASSNKVYLKFKVRNKVYYYLIVNEETSS